MKEESEVQGKPKFLKAQPVRNPREQASIDKFLLKLGPSEQGRIEEVPAGESLYNTPIFIKHEALDKDRLLHNSKHVNELIQEIKFYMAFTVRDIFEALALCLCATMLDLQASYYQFLVAERYRNLTAFTDYSTGKQYRLKCMGMGLKNSPAIMQQLMQEIFPDEMPYIDNLGFGTKGPVDEAWPLQRLRNKKNFAICRKFGLKLNLRKCIFLCGKVGQSIDCLGRKISSNWHSVDDKTADKVRNMKRPSSTKELVSTLCKLNWLRPYVRAFGVIAQPLYHFTSTIYEKKKIVWSDEAMPTSPKDIEKAVIINVIFWRDLLNACANPDLLYYFEEGKALYCCGDASNIGWGFIVFQLGREDLQFNDETPDINGVSLQQHLLISMNSGSFNKEQMKWSTTDQECYAFYKGIMDNKHLLFNRPFFMITDHKNLTFLVDSQSERVIRYKMALQTFSINWVHAPGTSRALFGPDALSRS